jgi:hypothetical protein
MSGSVISEQDWKLARKINKEARRNPASPYAGKFVGILDGKVVVVADSPEEGIDQLRAIDPDPMKGLLMEASADYDTPLEISGI